MTDTGPDLVALRRDIHAHPETAFCEVRTAATVAARLSSMGLDPVTGSTAMDVAAAPAYPDPTRLQAAAEAAVATGADEAWVQQVVRDGTAVVVDVVGDRPGPTWGLRFDTDALPIQESGDREHPPAEQGFASRFPGAMHACGHDGHVAIGLGLAHRLTADPAFPGRVRFLFQPAEEGGRGARAMIAAGAADEVDRFVALHLGLGLATREVVGGAVGAFATTKLAARFTGVASHAAAAPQEGRNALAAAAAATLAVLAQPRWSTTDTRVNVGTLHAGDAVNVIPAWAEMSAETRALDADVQAELNRRVFAALRGSAATYGVEVDVAEVGGSTTLASDASLSKTVADLADHLGGTGRPHGPMGGSDDASLFMAEVQRRGGLAGYTIVGADNPAPHHNPRFDIDEDALGFSVDLLDRLVREGR